LDRVKSIADFHGQHEQQYIMNRETHIDFLDTFAKLNNDVSKLEDVYQHLVKAENDLDRAIEKQNQASDRKELLAFQLQEIELISPLLGEDETLMADFKILKHADKLLTTANDLNARITEQDNSLYNELADIRKELEEISSIDEQVVPHLISLEEALNALMDTSEGLRKYATQIDHNPEQLERVESRLQEIESLKRKYGGSLETVINYCDEITIELESFKSLINEIDELTESINRFRSDFQQMATKLHELRSNSIQGLCSKIETELALLNIPVHHLM
jgi:DNA repair protein RecN (Recombination protein N)